MIRLLHVVSGNTPLHPTLVRDAPASSGDILPDLTKVYFVDGRSDFEKGGANVTQL
jgi:hypothetical protein